MITGINHITLAVSDLSRSIAFYGQTLGFRLVHHWPDGAYFDAGGLWLCLSRHAAVEPRDDSTHVAFSVDAEAFAEFEAAIRTQGVPLWRENRSEGPSVYFLDPDGHKLEVHVGDLASRMAAIGRPR